MNFVNDFAALFRTKTNESSAQAKLYLRGLLTEAPRKNMEHMDRHLGGGQYEVMQQFISASPWCEEQVFKAVARRACARLGDHCNTTLIIDESAHSKKGTKSCGVARQYNGRLGKQDNCQVGVYSALHCGTRSALIGAALHLPKEWTDDPERCAKAGVPPERIKQGALSKIDLARQLLDAAVTAGVRFACVAVDAFYGRDSGFRARVEELGLVYCADVPATTNVFSRKPGCGKRPRPIGRHTESVAALGAKIMEDKKQPGHDIDLREGENGLVRARVWARRVWEWPPEAEQAGELWLVIRRMSDGEMKYSLCNAPADTSISRLAIWQASRFYVERTFQDAKSHAGMSQYQCRGWRAWHHHMAMVCMATLFIMEERLANPLKMDLLSARDIVELLDWAFARHRTEQEMIDLINERHRQRARNAANAVARMRRRVRESERRC
jgi:SRSO17 transposase